MRPLRVALAAAAVSSAVAGLVAYRALRPGASASPAAAATSTPTPTPTSAGGPAVVREGAEEHPAIREQRLLLSLGEQERAEQAKPAAAAAQSPEEEHPAVREQRLLEALAREGQEAAPARAAPDRAGPRERGPALPVYAEEAPPPGPAPLPSPRAAPRRPAKRPAAPPAPAVEVPARLDAWGE